jgi:AraC-like DNA-binding protein
MSTKSKLPRTRVEKVGYQPPTDYRLDLEIFTLAEFRRRVTPAHLRAPQRLEFHLLIYIVNGHSSHMVDFELHNCQPGTLLVLRPGQVQLYSSAFRDLEGFMVLFRPEFLEPRPATGTIANDMIYQLADLSVNRILSGSEQDSVDQQLNRMAVDARRRADAGILNTLLRYQLLALLVRLQLIQASRAPAATQVTGCTQRFKRFREEVERRFHQLHQVSAYAKLIGCSQKSLQRATLELRGVTAKTFVSQRIALEAKRLLVHTNESVAEIADTLGFDEPTNFVKFFRREVDIPPGDFRRQHAVG